MSHAYRYGKTLFVCNSDLSGDLTITADDEREVTIPAEDLLQFIGQHIGDKVIAALEQLDGAEAIRLIVAGMRSD